MEQHGEYRIPGPREAVWTALNDPEVLAACVPGCQSMEKRSDEHFQADVKAKVGPVAATFHADLTLSDMNPPDGYTLTADVKGGSAGFGKGTARVDLSPVEDTPGETLLRYRVSANVGGKLAQIGSRLIDAAARKMADDFFGAFEQHFRATAATAAAGGEPPQPDSSRDAAAPSDVKTAGSGSGQWIIWGLVFAALAAALLLT